MVYIVHSRGNLFLHCHRIFTVQNAKIPCSNHKASNLFAFPQGILFLINAVMLEGHFICCECQIRTDDIRVMSPTR